MALSLDQGTQDAFVIFLETALCIAHRRSQLTEDLTVGQTFTHGRDGWAIEPDKNVPVGFVQIPVFQLRRRWQNVIGIVGSVGLELFEHDCKEIIAAQSLQHSRLIGRNRRHRKLTIAGYAQANARVTTLMNNLDATELLENARLIETKAETVGGRRVNAFIIEIQIARKTSDAKGEAAAKPAKKS